jgi:hypothetical protein
VQGTHTLFQVLTGLYTGAYHESPSLLICLSLSLWMFPKLCQARHTCWSMANASHAFYGLLKINQLQSATQKTNFFFIIFMQLPQVQQSHHNRLPRLQTKLVKNEKTLVKGKTCMWEEVEKLHTHDYKYCCCLWSLGFRFLILPVTRSNKTMPLLNTTTFKVSWFTTHT